MQDRIRRTAEIAYMALIFAAAFVTWWQASLLPPAPYDPLGPKSFPIWVSCGLVALAAMMLARLLLGKALGRAAQAMVTGLDGEAEHTLRPWTAGLTLLLAFLYALALSLAKVSFLPATAVYLFAAGAVLGPLKRKRLLVMAVFAIAAAFAVDFLFRVVFKLDLS